MFQVWGFRGDPHKEMGFYSRVPLKASGGFRVSG